MATMVSVVENAIGHWRLVSAGHHVGPGLQARPLARSEDRALLP